MNLHSFYNLLVLKQYYFKVVYSAIVWIKHKLSIWYFL